MTPNSLPGLAIFVLAAIPGYVHIRVVERRAPRLPRGALLELVDLVSVGLISITVGLLTTLAIGQLGGPVPTLDELSTSGTTGYITSHPWNTLLAVALSLVIATAIAWILAVLSTRTLPDVRIRAGSVWHYILNSDRQTLPPYCIVELVDGRLFEGFAKAYGTDDNGNKDDLALQAPLSVRVNARGDRMRLDGRAILLARDQIRLVQVIDLKKSAAS